MERLKWNKGIFPVVVLLCASVYLSMETHGWDMLGGLALFLGVLAVSKEV